MADPIAALEADRAILLKICEGLSDEEWSAPSGCPGWSVKDVVAHLGALYWAVVDPSRLPDVTGVPTEKAQEILVEASRGLSPVEVLEDYEAVSVAALEALASFAGVDLAVPLGDLGTYPASVLPTAFGFDHYLHIRADLFAPRGSLGGELPPVDELRVGPALDWVEVALPQQNGARLDAFAAAIEVAIPGVGGRTFTVGAGEAVARVTADADAFLRCITARMSWDEPRVGLSGADAALELLRTLRVF
jgi:uncharacterized protein (TIGR03083 family)